MGRGQTKETASARVLQRLIERAPLRDAQLSAFAYAFAAQRIDGSRYFAPEFDARQLIAAAPGASSESEPARVAPGSGLTGCRGRLASARTGGEGPRRKE